MIIVDDNKKLAASVAEMIDWKELGVEISGLFSNAKAALGKIQEISPNIVLTDIVMPYMNGLEFAKELKQNYSNIKIIFMSSYDEFEYVKSAINLEAESYLLKPIDEDELKKSVIKTVEKINLEEKNKYNNQILFDQITKMNNELSKLMPLYKEQFFRELLIDGLYDENEIEQRLSFLSIDMSNSKIRVLSIILDENDSLLRSPNANERYAVFYTFLSELKELNSSDLRVYSIKVSSNEIVAVAVSDKIYSEDEKDMFFERIINLKENIKGKLKVQFKIGVSPMTSELKGLDRFYKCANEVARDSFFTENNQIIFYEDVKSIGESYFDERVDLKILYNEVESIVNSGDEAKIDEFICKYLGSNSETYQDIYIKILTFSIVNNLNIILMKSEKSFKDIFGENESIWVKLQKFDSIKDIKQWIKNVVNSVSEVFGINNELHNEKIVDDIKNTIKKRYSKQISISEMIKELYISSGHANILFKRATGKTIFDYLTEYRMEMAKKLIKDPYSRIYIVASSVGYSNISHFCSLFKNYTGLSPTEYKNKQ